jgi:hypothetical protein
MADAAPSPSPPPAARSTEDVVALSLMVILNWLLAHIATSWVLPPEVQSATQTLLTVCIAMYIDRAKKPTIIGTFPPEPLPAPPAAQEKPP